jgi:hypothetical protein
MARPDVEVVRVHPEDWRAFGVGSGGHLQLNVLVRDVRLLIIHPEQRVDHRLPPIDNQGSV